MGYYPDFTKTTVLVVGDVMLDRYFWGDVERISPEAPVPVVHVLKKNQVPGGAGNVALNLSGLGADCHLIGVCGNDEAGEFLVSYFARQGITTDLINIEGRSTTAKTRIIGRGQQLLRMDEEETGVLPHGVYENLFRIFNASVENAHAVIISDYGKGVFQQQLARKVIGRCAQNKIPVFVDPKGNDWGRYEGATCITPNTAEFKLVAPDMTGDDASFEREAKRVMDQYHLSQLLVTKGPRGMSLFHQNRKSIHITSDAREVFDVSGAGDTVISTLAASVGAGMDTENAARLANMAAGIVVGKIGTKPITAKELEQTFYGKVIGGINKRMLPGEASEFIAKWRNQGQQIVFTNGCFDILHIGHIKLLHAAAAEGDKLIVGLNSDASIKKIKGPLRPVMGEDERAAILSSLKCVDMVVVFSEETPIELIKAFQPDVIVKGGDYTPETVVGHDIVRCRGGRVVIVPLVEGFSTTGKIERMKKSETSKRHE